MPVPQEKRENQISAEEQLYFRMHLSHEDIEAVSLQ